MVLLWLSTTLVVGFGVLVAQIFRICPGPGTLLWRTSSSWRTLTQPPLGGLLGATVTLLWIFRGTLIPWIALVQSGGERKTPIRVETLGISAGIGSTGFLWTFVAHMSSGLPWSYDAWW